MKASTADPEARAAFANRGDRLVFSNGIVILAIFSALLVMAFGGDTSRLIPLYAVERRPAKSISSESVQAVYVDFEEEATANLKRSGSVGEQECSW